MNSIITYLVLYNQYLLKTISELILFIAKFIPLKQLAFEDSNSPSYQKFKLDILPIIKKFEKQDFNFLLEYYFYKYGKPIKPVQRRNGRTIPEDTICPLCDAPHLYIYDNNGGKGQFQCKVCGHTFSSGERIVSPITLICPYCQHILSPKMVSSTLGRIIFIHLLCVTLSYSLSQSIRLARCFLF